MAPVNLPCYVIFKADNGNNLCRQDFQRHPYLLYNSTNRDLTASHEVVPLPGKEDVVRIKSLDNGLWWRRSLNWIWADESKVPEAKNVDCLFKAVQLSSNKVVLQNLGNNRYVKRFTYKGKTSALNVKAAADDHRNDLHTQLEVSEALSARRVFDVEYLMDQLHTTDMFPLMLGNVSADNNTSYKSDVSATISYEASESSTWSNSLSFSTGLSVTITAGILKVAEGSTTVSSEMTSMTEIGKEIVKSVLFEATFTIKDMDPGCG